MDFLLEAEDRRGLLLGASLFNLEVNLVLLGILRTPEGDIWEFELLYPKLEIIPSGS